MKNPFILISQIALILTLFSCKSTKPADLCGLYQSNCNINLKAISQNKLKSYYRLELNDDSTMRISFLPFNKFAGNGLWHDNGKLIILDLNVISNPESKKIIEGLTGIKSLESMYIVLDKKGRNKLLINKIELKKIKSRTPLNDCQHKDDWLEPSLRL